jgi:iron(III) transport system permease protein
MGSRRLTLSLTAALFLGLGLAPLMVMFAPSLTVDETFGLDRYRDLWASPRLPQLFGRSVLLAGLATLGTIGLGVPIGLLLGKTDLPGRRLLAAGFTLPLLLPPYFLALGWFALLGRESWLARLLPESAIGTLSEWLFGLPGCAVTLATVFLPLIVLLTAMLLHSVNPRLEEAARLYASWPTVLGRITLPAIGPGVLFGAVLVFLLVLGELTVPMFLRYDVYPVEILTQFAAFYDFDAATAAAAPLALVVGLPLAAEWRSRRFAAPDLRPAGTSLSIRLGASQRLWTAGVSGLLLVLVVLPFGALLLHASPADFGDAWRRAGDALGRSLLYAALGASLLTAFGFFLGLLWRERTHGAGFTEFAALLLLILPSPVIGIGLIGLWNRPATAGFYASPGLLLMGYLIQYAALAGGIARSVLVRLPPSLEQAAAVAGFGWWRRILFIALPLSRRGLLTAWLVAYLFCLRDTGLALLVYPPGGDTLPVRIFTLMANSPFGLVAALCALLMAAALPPLILIGLLPRGRERSP